MFIKIPLWKQVLQKFSKPEIHREAFFAYFHRLPEKLQVSWFRDDGMIIGTVNAGDKEFMTQGADADDFIRMVNESLITVFNVPQDYFSIIKKAKTYNPNPAERKLLEDMNVAKSTIGLVKSDAHLKLA